MPIFYFLFCFFIFVNLRRGEKSKKTNPKKKDKKRSKYVALDFSEKTNPKKRLKKKQIRSLRFFCPFLIFYFLFCFFIFVNLREGEKNTKKKNPKKKR